MIHKDQKERSREVSKEVQKTHQSKDEDKARKMQNILKEVKGTKNILNFKSAEKADSQKSGFSSQKSRTLKEEPYPQSKELQTC